MQYRDQAGIQTTVTIEVTCIVLSWIVKIESQSRYSTDLNFNFKLLTNCMNEM